MSTFVAEQSAVDGVATLEASFDATLAPPLLTLQPADARLAHLAATGSEEAFATIVARFRPGLLRYAERIVGPAHAEDAVQQALVNAWRALDGGSEVRALRPWLYTIVHRSALELLRSHGRPCAELSVSLSGGRSPHEQAEIAGRAETTLSALAQLPDAERDALVATSVHGRSARDTATALGVSEAAVRQLVFRARTHMREATAGALSALPFPAMLQWVRRRAHDLAARMYHAGDGGSAASATAAKLTAAIALGAAVATPALVVPSLSSQSGGDATTTAQPSGAPPSAAAVVRRAHARRNGEPSAPPPGAPGAPGRLTGPSPGSGEARDAGVASGQAPARSVAGATASGLAGAGSMAPVPLPKLPAVPRPGRPSSLTTAAGEAVGTVGATVAGALPVAGGATEAVTHTAQGAVGAGAGVVEKTGATVHGAAEAVLPGAKG